MEIRASDADVRMYLQNQIEKEGRLKLHIQADPSLRNTIIDTIIKKSQGMSVSYSKSSLLGVLYLVLIIP
jgi:hypothetical protein